jgi:hypothetical protein
MRTSMDSCPCAGGLSGLDHALPIRDFTRPKPCPSATQGLIWGARAEGSRAYIERASYRISAALPNFRFTPESGGAAAIMRILHMPWA